MEAIHITAKAMHDAAVCCSHRMSLNPMPWALTWTCLYRHTVGVWQVPLD